MPFVVPQYIPPVPPAPILSQGRAQRAVNFDSQDSKLNANLSGIVLNQNARPSETDFYEPTSTPVYQEFFLPPNYKRGAESGEMLIPDLSGFQLAVEVLEGTESTVTFDWDIEYQVFGLGWITVASGTALGAHTYGPRVWMNVFFDDPVPVDDLRLTARWRIKITGGPSKIWFSSPNPLSASTAKARDADGVTPLTSSVSGASIPSSLLFPGTGFPSTITGSEEYSFMFRILGLTADEGTDFLGNPYRSAVVSQSVSNVDTRDGGNTDKYWLSKPNPSRFAVESLYFDVRPETSPTYEIVNYITNPSFEADLTGATAYNSSTLTQTSTWATAGSYSARSQKTLTSTGSFQSGGGIQFTAPVIPLTNYCLQADSNVLSAYGGGIRMSIEFRDSTNTIIGSVNTLGPITPATGIKQIVFNTTSPANAVTAILTFYMESATGPAGTADFMIDSVLFGRGVGPLDYVDGDFSNHIWAGNRGNSQTIEVIPPDNSDNVAVIDKVLLDPLTPGMYFHVYYSNEGDPGTTDVEWEDKLWTPVHKTFKADKRDTFALPSPVSAKYIKIEFSHLQAKHYAPGNFAKPIAYKKHPAWVLDYFLGRLASQKAVENNLGVGSVGIVYNALDIAYNYYLDDLNQAPDQPAEYLSGSPVPLGTDQVDPSVLNQINLSMAPYREGPLSFAKDNLLGSTLKQAAAASNIPYPSEGGSVPGTPEFTELQSLRDESVVFENDYPVMFFYLRCRHGYRVITGGFSHDRAYFAGINEIAFTRDNYTIAHDNDQYIEPGADLFNVERNDFTNEDGNLVL